MVQTTAPRPQKSLAVAVTVAATVCGCAAGCRQRLPPAGWRLVIVAGWGASGAIENVFWNGWLIWFLLMLIPANIFLLFCGI